MVERDTAAESSPAGDGRREAEALGLEQEHARDEAALAEALREEDARLEAGADQDRPGPAGSHWLALPRRTRALVVGLAAGLVLLAGIQVGKLTAAGDPAPPTPAAAPDSAAPGAPRAEPGITRGEIVAIAGSTLYVRLSDGRTVALRTSPPPRVARARPAPAGGLRPGDAIVAESSRAADGRLTARSITVLPPSERRRGRP